MNLGPFFLMIFSNRKVRRLHEIFFEVSLNLHNVFPMSIPCVYVLAHQVPYLMMPFIPWLYTSASFDKLWSVYCLGTIQFISPLHQGSKYSHPINADLKCLAVRGNLDNVDLGGILSACRSSVLIGRGFLTPHSNGHLVRLSDIRLETSFTKLNLVSKCQKLR